MLNSIWRRPPPLRLAHLVFIVPLACLAVLPLVSLTGSEPGLVTCLVAAGVLALATVKPRDALLVCAGLAPLAGPLGVLIGTSVGLAEAMVLAFLGGWLIHETVRFRLEERTCREALTPVVLFAGAVAASCAVQMLVMLASSADPWEFGRRVGTFLTFGYFHDHRQFPSITASALLLEGVGLYVAVVTLCRRDISTGPRVARMVGVCATGVAALNIYQLLRVSVRWGVPVMELARGDSPMRISYVFPDVNAAGSYLAMTLLLAGALVFDGRRARVGWIAAACFMLGALWLTGSRTAIVAVPMAGLFLFVATASVRGRSLVWLALAGAVALLLVVLATVRVFDTSQRPLSAAANIRVELARTGLRMFATQPFFGVGVGSYYALSEEFASPLLRRSYPRENAHNNLLQILAELGIVGFGAFAWLLLAVGRHIWRARKMGGLSPLALGAASGLIAFLLTCLAGHPLLIPEVAYAFWLVLGLTAGLVEHPARVTSPAPAIRRWSSRCVLTGAIALLLVVSIPVRAWQLTTEANIGRAPVGLSDWQTDKDGASFRWMDERAQFSIPAVARAVTLPLRLEVQSSVGGRAVEIYVDGLFVSRIRLMGHQWHEIRFIIPPVPPGTHFRRIELRAPPSDVEAGTSERPPGQAPPRIQVGQPRLTFPPT